MPINVIIRDVIGFARNTREVREILNKGLAKVDGRVVKDRNRGVGLMDVLSLGDQHYRCVLDKNGRLRYRPISAEDASWKVCRVENKTTIKGGMTQFHLHDGRNILSDDANAYNTGDSLKVSIPTQEVLEHIRFGEGTRCYLIGGVHVGTIAAVNEYHIKRSSMPNEVQFAEFGTIARNVFAVGNTSLPGVEVNE